MLFFGEECHFTLTHQIIVDYGSSVVVITASVEFNTPISSSPSSPCSGINAWKAAIMAKPKAIDNTFSGPFLTFSTVYHSSSPWRLCELKVSVIKLFAFADELVWHQLQECHIQKGASRARLENDNGLFHLARSNVGKCQSNAHAERGHEGEDTDGRAQSFFLISGMNK